MNVIDCDRCRELIPEVALGVAVGEERAAVLDHAVGCAGCRRELAEISALADELLSLAPAVEPSTGFEVRALAGFSGVDAAVASRAGLRESPSLSDRNGLVSADPTSMGKPSTQGPAPSSRRRGGRTIRRLIAAAVVLALVGLGVAVARDKSGSGPGRAGSVFAASGWELRDPSGTGVGRVFVRRGPPGRLEVHLDRAAPGSSYRVECDYAAGPSYVAGTVATTSGPSSVWSANVSTDLYELRRVRLVSTGAGPNLEATVAGP